MYIAINIIINTTRPWPSPPIAITIIMINIIGIINIGIINIGIINISIISIGIIIIITIIIRSHNHPHALFFSRWALATLCVGALPPW